jgi:hypothetical protein
VLAVTASAATIGCSWCMDFGYWESAQRGIDPRKLRDVPRWRDSPLYSDLERQVMAYAEAMTTTRSGCPTRWSPACDGNWTMQLVELAMMVDRHRRLLFGVAYQLLGSVADAEDTVQDAWLRWSADTRDDVADPRPTGCR